MIINIITHIFGIKLIAYLKYINIDLLIFNIEIIYQQYLGCKIENMLENINIVIFTR